MKTMVEFIGAHWKAGFEILLLAAVMYYFLLLFRGTRGAAVFTGFVIVLFMVAAVTQVFQLDVVNWIMGRFLAFLAIAILVIFQPELRRALATLGSQTPFTSYRQRVELIDIVVEAAVSLSQKRCGALMAIEREIGFRGITETGVAIDAKATPDLLGTIFFPNTPLHDGGVVLRGDRIVSAACIFPITQQEGLRTALGMRHRAAIGLTEETDAVVVVVSEETGIISAASGGRLTEGLEGDSLRQYLSSALPPTRSKGIGVTDFIRRTVSGLFIRDTRTPVEGAPSGEEASPPDTQETE